LTDDQRTVTFKVEDLRQLEGVKPGDRIDVTRTEAFRVTLTVRQPCLRASFE
jgi:hypothetical protein